MEKIRRHNNPHACVKRLATINSRLRFCRLDRAEQRGGGGGGEGLIQLDRYHCVTDEWNSGWPTLFRVPPHHCVPFSQSPPSPFLSTPFSLFPSFPLHPGEASSLPHYSDVIAPPSDVTTHVASTLPRGQRPLSAPPSPLPFPFFINYNILSVVDKGSWIRWNSRSVELERWLSFIGRRIQISSREIKIIWRQSWKVERKLLRCN